MLPKTAMRRRPTTAAREFQGTHLHSRARWLAFITGWSWKSQRFPTPAKSNMFRRVCWHALLTKNFLTRRILEYMSSTVTLSVGFGVVNSTMDCATEISQVVCEKFMFPFTVIHTRFQMRHEMDVFLAAECTSVLWNFNVSAISDSSVTLNFTTDHKNTVDVLTCIRRITTATLATRNLPKLPVSLF